MGQHPVALALPIMELSMHAAGGRPCRCWMEAAGVAGLQTHPLLHTALVRQAAAWSGQPCAGKHAGALVHGVAKGWGIFRRFLPAVPSASAAMGEEKPVSALSLLACWLKCRRAASWGV